MVDRALTAINVQSFVFIFGTRSPVTTAFVFGQGFWDAIFIRILNSFYIRFSCFFISIHVVFTGP